MQSPAIFRQSDVFGAFHAQAQGPPRAAAGHAGETSGGRGRAVGVGGERRRADKGVEGGHSREDTMKVQRMFGVLAVALVLLATVLAACGEEYKGLPLAEEPYRNEDYGFTIRYPEGWECHFHRSDFYGDMVWCIRWDKVLWVAILTSPTENWEFEGRSRAQHNREILEQALLYIFRYEPEEPEFGTVRTTKVGRHDAAYVDIPVNDPVPGDPIVFRVVCAEVGDQVVAIIGEAYLPDEAWEEIIPSFIPTFEAMLESMTFFEPQHWLWE